MCPILQPHISLTLALLAGFSRLLAAVATLHPDNPLQDQLIAIEIDRNRSKWPFLDVQSLQQVALALFSATQVVLPKARGENVTLLCRL